MALPKILKCVQNEPIFGFGKVSDYCIKKGLKEISEEDYMATLQKLASEKWASVNKETNLFAKLRKTQDYLLQKGYEHELIKQVLQLVQQAE